MEAERREVRSYVLRQGRLTPGQEKALKQQWSRFGLESGQDKLVLGEVFRNTQPLHVEIGFGMGDSLVKQAAQKPQINFVGCEVHLPGVGHLLRLSEENDLHNIRVFRDDSDVMLEALPDHCVDCLQIFFPDPWHKKRHHKRRLINRRFLDQIQSKLKTGAVVHIATDWLPYAEWITETFALESSFEFTEVPVRPKTKFEARGERLGHEVTDLAWRFRPTEAGR